ncbi:FtsX-like permease family protein [Streptomyces sp. NPDC002276]
MTGGRDGWARTALMAIGIGLGVALLLVASSVPTARHHRDERIHNRIDTNLDDRIITPSRGTVLLSDIDTVFRGREIRGRMLEPEGPAAPLPPGLKRFPRPGEMAVSPALRKLLAAPGSALLRERLDHPVTGEVTDRGLVDPSEYVFYLGGEHMAVGVAGADRLDHFGKTYPQKPLDPALTLLSIVGMVVLLAPVAVFIAAAVRFGGERRDRRLAALRLVGADRRMTARIAAGETLVSALIGVALGAVLFMIGRQFIELLDIQGLSVFTEDFTPQPALAALTVVGVLLLSLAVTRLAMNGVAVEPLGVVRRSGGATRRLWWRVTVPVLGLSLLKTSMGSGSEIRSTTSVVLVVVGMLALLVGVTAVLPWILEQLTGALGGFGPVSWQLAVRRLQLNSEAATRSVNGIVVAVAGAIALQTLFTGIAHGQNGNSGAARSSSAPTTQVGVASLDDGKGYAERYASVFSSTPGVQQAIGYAELSVSTPDGDFPQTVRVAECGQLRLLASLSTCADGDAFVVGPHGGGSTAARTVWKPGSAMRMDTNGPRWTVPRITAAVEARSSNPQGVFPEKMLFVTPRAAGTSAMAHAVSTIDITYATSAGADIQDRLRTTAARLDPSFAVDFPAQAKGDTALDGIERDLLAGVAAVLLLIAASMLLGALEQLRDRKRVLAVLITFGTPRRTLSSSILWQTAVPVATGLLVAGVVGTALGNALLGLIGRTPVYDWSNMLAIAGIGAAASVSVTVLTLPTLWRSSHPANLRHE